MPASNSGDQIRLNNPLLGWLSPSRMVKVGLTLAPALVALQVILLGAVTSGWERTIVNDVMAPIATLLATLGLAYGAYWTAQHKPAERLTWILIACSGLSTAIGDILVFFQEVIRHSSATPSTADLFYLATYPLFLIAILALPGKRLSMFDLGKLVLDIAILVAASALIVWVTVIRPILAAGPTDFNAMLVAVAYPVDDIIMIWALAMLLLRPDLVHPRLPYWLFAAAGVLVIIGDTLATGFQAQAVYPSESWLNVMYLAAPLVYMMSGLFQAQQITIPKIPNLELAAKIETAHPNLLRMAAPYLLLGGTYILLWETGLTEPTASRSIIFAWEAIIIFLVILRQVITLVENYRLARDLNELNDELERRVSLRTVDLVRANNSLHQEMDQRLRVEHALHEREEKLAHNATHDALTDLPNRLLFQGHLSQDIQRIHDLFDYRFALLYLDFDGFNIINDSLGHQAGDALLVQIAGRIRAALKTGNIAARLGGDEFAILLEDFTPMDNPRREAENLLHEISKPFEVAGHRIFLTASIGVVMGDNTYQDPAEILRDADLAMYEAKAQGKARYVMFDPQLRKHALDRLVLGSDLRTALEGNEFCLEYQPILSLETNRITGVEALIRWRHPERGLMAPNEFLPIAETSGLIFPITRWVLDQACGQVHVWQSEFPALADLTLNINFSPKLFTQPELPKMVTQALAASGLAPSALHVEITEAAFLQKSEDIQNTLDAWHAAGIGIQMDDFGMEFSSLSYLRQYPIDTLKIAQTFVKRIHGTGNPSEIVRRIVVLARDLHLKVVAGGVESAEELAYLRELGCQSVQGFFISQPLDVQAAWAFLTSEEIERKALTPEVTHKD
jgi:diguanylate cyclase (GGDEF)-like protein